ncbi:MAG: anti-sigma factor [Eudoraea sp.]|nr:anti-sigma factor [Eudoraea sp.]
MDKQRIIEDGILTAYLLGTLDQVQEAQVAQVLEQDKELREMYSRLEADFERMAMENAIAPPDPVLTGLKNELEASSASPVIDLKTDKRTFTQLRSRLLVAASLAALFALSAFWFYSQWQDATTNLNALQNQTADLQQRINSLEGNLQLTTRRYQMLTNPEVITVVLEGNKIMPDSRAIAYMNHTSKEVVVNPKGLPPLEADKTYQMWADVDGVMINMGLVPTDKEWVELAYIDEAESLNITIEPAGGNDHPTVENLISFAVL